MGKKIHQTIPVQVWADIDVGIADTVRYLNTIPGVRTHASCQGTLGEGGAAPYQAFVMVSWPDKETLRRLQSEFDIEVEGDYWGRAYPREKGQSWVN